MIGQTCNKRIEGFVRIWDLLTRGLLEHAVRVLAHSHTDHVRVGVYAVGTNRFTITKLPEQSARSTAYIKDMCTPGQFYFLLE